MPAREHIMHFTVPPQELKSGVREKRQCTAHTKETGERCRLPPIRGGFVCSLHGGGTPMAKLGARKRLLAMCEPAFGVLEDVLADDTADVEVRVKAAFGVLDRAGFGPKAHLTVENKRPNLEGVDLEERGRKILAIMQARKTQVIDSAIEADVVRRHDGSDDDAA